ncbi:MAG TPA: sialidase family protein [bacterium]|jgi:predicted neuraminidase|nr:sialidase family protein [bacterium]
MKSGYIIFSPGEKYQRENRKWQGIPSIERTENGILWATWYSGGEGEGPNNYIILVKSIDNGETWTQPILVIDPPGNTRAFDPCLWIDPLNRLWLFWSMSNGWFDGKAGVWCIRADNPDNEKPVWNEPRNIAYGIMINKPLILSSGEWLFPVALWNKMPYLPEMENLRFSCVYISTDEGKTINFLGFADVPERSYDEHMIVELKDNRLWMLVRTYYGIGESFSFDKGRTWTHGKPSSIKGPCSRFHIRRLLSGNLLLINHYGFNNKNRSHLTALISDDDGKTWKFNILLDERNNVSYPDAVQAKDGRIFIIYDHDRYGKKEILMATITETDIKAGKIVTPGSMLKRPIYT